jgi:hypothetical protein
LKSGLFENFGQLPDLWLCGAIVENNIFGSATLLRRPEFLVGMYLFRLRSAFGKPLHPDPLKKSVWRIRDVYPGSRIQIFSHPRSRYPGSKNSNKRKGRKKKFVVITFYVATNFTKFEIILVLKCRRKKFGPIFKEL